MPKKPKAVSNFTGKIVHPVVRRINRNIDVIYTFSDGPQKKGEDWSLPLEAHEKRDTTYDVRVYGEIIANVHNYDSAIDLMSRYIDEKGKFRRLEEV